MFEARVGKNGLSPPQKRRVLLRLKIARYGHRKHKFKKILHFDRRERVSLPLLVKIRSRFCSCQNFGVSEERFSAISASALLQANIWRKPLNFQLPAPFLQWCQAQVGFLLLPESWACKRIEEGHGLGAVANLSSDPPPRLSLIPLYLSFLLM